MKFHQVSIGEQFVFQGDTFTKASPVLASNNVSGEQRFMRRADAVQPCGDVTLEKDAQDKEATVKMDRVLLLVDEYVEDVISRIKTDVDGLSSEHYNAISKLMKRRGVVLQKSLGRHKE